MDQLKKPSCYEFQKLVFGLNSAPGEYGEWGLSSETGSAVKGIREKSWDAPKKTGVKFKKALGW